MSDSDARIPASLFALPAPLGLIALITLLGFVSLQTRQPAEKNGKSTNGQSQATPASQATAADGEFPPLHVLLEYLGNAEEQAEHKVAAVVRSTEPAMAASAGKVDKSSAPGLSDSVSRESNGGDSIVELRNELSRLARHDLKLECLIALVPDPIDSHFPLMFDNTLASIQAGFESHDFVRDRHYLLWQDALATGTNKPAGGMSVSRLWRERPSAILFRKTKPSSTRDTAADVSQLVLLLLVGETPTTGVHKQALSAALDFVAAWEMTRLDVRAWEMTREVHRRGSPVPIRILGPEFSGSAPSLRLELCNWWDRSHKLRRIPESTDNAPPQKSEIPREFPLERVAVTVLSGSATSDNNKTILTIPSQRADGKTDILVSQGATDFGLTVEFHATVLPDGPATDAVLNYLHQRRGIPIENIAILQENTSYGSSLGSSLHHSEDGKHDEKSPYEAVRTLGFPLSLSRMRSEYEKSGTAQAESTGALGQRPATSRRNLDLGSESLGNAIDVLPTFSNSTPATADLVLEHLLATIKRDGIRAVGIVATDVQDVIFLARQVRVHTPDVLLFVLDSDILHTHSDSTQYLEGMLVASTYPLFTRNRRWTMQGQRDLAFPSSTSHGVFNATVAHLNHILCDSSEPDFEPVGLLDYAFPFSNEQNVNARPPLWLTMVGDTGFWPVDVIQLEDNLVHEYTYPGDDPPVATTKARLVRNIFRPSRFSVMLTSSIALILSALFLLRNWKTTEPLNTESIWPRRTFCWMSLRKLSDDGSSYTGPVHGIRCLLAATLLSGMLFLQVSVSSPAWMYWLFHFRESSTAKDWLTCLVAVSAVGMLTLLLTMVFWWWFVSLQGKLHRSFLAAGIVMVGLVFMQLFLWIPLTGRPVDQAIFIERVGELSSGVSPLLPLSFVVTAIMFWAVSHWRREYYCEIHKLANPLTSKEPAAGESGPLHSTAQQTMHLAGISRRFEHLENRIESLVFRPTEPMDWVFIVLVAANLCYIGVHWITTAEGIRFDWLFGPAAAVAVICFVYLFLYIKAVCGLFERLLRRLGQHAMVDSYRRVPQRLRDKVSGQIFSSGPHSGDLEAHVRCLIRLADLSCELPADQHKLVPPEEHRNTPRPPAGQSARQMATVETEVQREAKDIGKDFALLLELERSQKHRAQLMASHLNSRMAELARTHLVPCLQRYWDETAVMDPKLSENPSEGKSSSHEPGNPTIRWCREAETFLAMQLVGLIRQVFAQIQNLMTFFVAMLLCLVIAVQSYPFIPVRLIQLTCSWIVIWVLTAVFIVMVRFNRNEILSLISESIPNRFTPDRSFVQMMLIYVVIPVVGLLSMQFPAVGRILFGWLSDIRLLVGV